MNTVYVCMYVRIYIYVNSLCVYVLPPCDETQIDRRIGFCVQLSLFLSLIQSIFYKSRYDEVKKMNLDTYREHQ